MRTKQSTQNTGNRILIIALALVGWMLVIVGRMYWLQVVKHDHYLSRARENQQSQSETMAARGAILDRNGKDLALSVFFDSIFVDQRMLKTDAERQEAAKVLAPLLEMKEADLVKQMTGTSGFAFLARRVDAEKARIIKETVAEKGLKAIGFRKEAQRFYPNESLAAAALGFVDSGNNGQAGLEQSQNKLLNGKSGAVEFERDGRNQAYERHETPAIGGATISTTLDAPMQHKIEVLLNEAVKSHSAKGAYAIVMDVTTGEILALANAPSFDPNERPKGKVENRHNAAISFPYEPGSVFKIVTYSAAFEEGKVTLDEKLNCGNGQIQFGPRIIRDTHAYGIQQTPDAFAKSSNVCAIKMAQRVGKEKFAEYISKFGFGSKTGIELPAESRGIVRPVEKWNFDSIGSIAIGQEVSVTLIQEAAAVGVIANKGVWTQPHIIRRAVGQDGKLIYEAKPNSRQVVSEQTAANMSVLMQRVVTHGTARHAIELGNYTAAGKTGTPQKAEQKYGYTRGKFMPAFAGFVPATDPRFVIVVMVDEPAGGAHQGGSVSAPIFNMVAQIALGDFAVPPDAKGFRDALVALSNRYETKAAEDDAGEMNGQNVVAQTQPDTKPEMQNALPKPGAGVLSSANIPPNAAGQTAKPKTSPTQQPAQKPQADLASTAYGMMPDLRGKGLRSVIQACNQLSLNLKSTGSGVATKQWPAPGTRVRPGEDCKVEFQ
ncbi:MAG TPA: penicillin-binding protein [Blastocatellia bacterium]|nr:penicillin-binding protein [Blastocatellia bacterium]